MKQPSKQTRPEKIARLEAKVGRLSRQLTNLREEENDEVHRPILRKSVGKCFKYLNSYGGYGGDHEKWWLYARVVSFDEKNLTYKTVQFQHTSMQRVEIEYERCFNWQAGSYFDNSWIEITRIEYNEAARK